MPRAQSCRELALVACNQCVGDSGSMTLSQDMFSVHRIVAREFLFWLLDICILPLMVIVFVSWRGPGLCRELMALWRDPGAKLLWSLPVLHVRDARTHPLRWVTRPPPQTGRSVNGSTWSRSCTP